MRVYIYIWKKYIYTYIVLNYTHIYFENFSVLQSYLHTMSLPNSSQIYPSSNIKLYFFSTPHPQEIPNQSRSVVLSKCSSMCGLPLEHGWLLRGYILDDMILLLSEANNSQWFLSEWWGFVLTLYSMLVFGKMGLTEVILCILPWLLLVPMCSCLSVSGRHYFLMSAPFFWLLRSFCHCFFRALWTFGGECVLHMLLYELCPVSVFIIIHSK